MSGSADEDVSRRTFLKSVTAAAAATSSAGFFAAAGEPEKRSFKIGLIGCGGRGGGAINDCITAGKLLGVDINVVAVADAYADRANGVAKAHNVPENRVFTGFSAFRKLVDTDVDIVLMATSPNFRPAHVAAAVAAGKHMFIEKPVAVDPVGCQKMYKLGEEAKKKKLVAVAGTCLRHAKGYASTRKVVAEDKAIGKIQGGTIYYCVGRLWFRTREPAWTDAEYMVRNWVSFVEMSGDHIVEQYVHTLDMLNWYMGTHPIATVGVGGRARRKTGNQFDFFSNDLEYPNNVHVHGICRQVDGCFNKANALELACEKGYSNGNGVVKDADGNNIPLPTLQFHDSMYVQEHIVLLDSLLKGQPVNDIEAVTDATLSSVMSRISAYTGQRVTWDEMMKSGLALTPTADDFEAGTVKAPPDDVVSIPGKG